MPNQTYPQALKHCIYCQASFDLESDHWVKKTVKRKTPIQFYCRKHKNEMNRKWYDANRDHNISISKKYYEEHREQLLNYQKTYYLKHSTQLKNYQKEYFQNHREKVRIRRYKYYSKPEERIRSAVNRGLHSLIKNQVGKYRYLSFTNEQLIIHLQKLFQPEMSLQNYGEWHIDHIIPIRFKNADGTYYWNQQELSDVTSNTFKRCWALDNLQPKWASENISKSNKFIG